MAARTALQVAGSKKPRTKKIPPDTWLRCCSSSEGRAKA
jgi:hypothetical protein